MSGYFEVGIYRAKTPQNVGTLWRSAYQLGAAGIFTIGHRYGHQVSDTLNTPHNIPLRQHDDWAAFMAARPPGAQLVGNEMGGVALSEFKHPPLAVYLLGAEDTGLPPHVLAACQSVVYIEAARTDSYNVAVAGSLVMYHRLLQRWPK